MKLRNTALIFAFLLTACGGGEDTGSDNAFEAVRTDEWHFVCVETASGYLATYNGFYKNNLKYKVNCQVVVDFYDTSKQLISTAYDSSSGIESGEEFKFIVSEYISRMAEWAHVRGLSYEKAA